MKRLFVVAILFCIFGPCVFASTRSYVRIVSLSFVSGTVLARRPGFPKWASAALNMPIEEGSSVVTARDSFAEVQFENGSTLRVGQLSRVDFTQLAFAARDGYINHLKLVTGLATIHIIAKRRDIYMLLVSGASLLPYGNTEFRTELRRQHLRVEVFRGHLKATDASRTAQLDRNQVLDCDYSDGGTFQVTSKIQMDQWDAWVQKRDGGTIVDAYSGSGPGMYDWEDDLSSS